MSIRVFIIIVLLFATSNLTTAQRYEFKVLAQMGEPILTRGNVSQPLKTGAPLIIGDEITISERGYVALVHSSGRGKELKIPGKYSVATLSSEAGNESSLTKKFINFMLNDKKPKEKQSNIVGGIHRGRLEPIVIFLPEREYSAFYNTSITLAWRTIDNVAGPFVVTVRNLAYEEMLTLETPAMRVQVDFDKGSLKAEQYFLVEVKDATNGNIVSPVYSITRLAETEQQRIAKELAALKTTLDPQSALDNLILAAFYEENKLIIDAHSAYSTAVALAPEVDIYQQRYNDFLKRYGFISTE
jgi:hypothetical protein